MHLLRQDYPTRVRLNRLMSRVAGHGKHFWFWDNTRAFSRQVMKSIESTPRYTERGSRWIGAITQLVLIPMAAITTDVGRIILCELSGWKQDSWRRVSGTSSTLVQVLMKSKSNAIHLTSLSVLSPDYFCPEFMGQVRRTYGRNSENSTRVRMQVWLLQSRMGFIVSNTQVDQVKSSSMTSDSLLQGTRVLEETWVQQVLHYPHCARIEPAYEDDSLDQWSWRDWHSRQIESKFVIKARDFAGFSAIADG